MQKMPPPRVFDSFLKLCLYTNTKNQSQLSVKVTKVSDFQWNLHLDCNYCSDNACDAEKRNALTFQARPFSEFHRNTALHLWSSCQLRLMGSSLPHWGSYHHDRQREKLHRIVARSTAIRLSTVKAKRAIWGKWG